MKRNVKICVATLNSIPFFAGLQLAELEALANRLRGYRYAASTAILMEQDCDDGVYWLVSGYVSVACYGHDAKVIAFRELGPGDMFGEIASIDHHDRSARVTATTDTLVAGMSSAAFHVLIDSNSVLRWRLLRKLTSLVRALSDRAIEFSTMSVRGRVRTELYRLAKPVSEVSEAAIIARPPRHADVAARVATHREAVSREISHLRRLGLLDCSRRDAWIIRDYAALGRLVDEARNG
ncbi:MAG: Crp/Fnr family transcriptional regulator [Gammaproteobacteria bacterium]|jgi:CRP/FNR family transcriptional regulator, cyclic AMP receptor protein|nr:Crp/Fnr family transcriptional regulator [Gammaproteobacteria bacterium]